MIKPEPRICILYGFLSVLLGSVLVWLFMGLPQNGIDDADIFFVYARHFSQGNGWVYNIGGERVEGFTSLLWALICSGVSLFARSVDLPLYLFNLLIGTAVVCACLRRIERRGLFLLFLVSSPAWFVWCQVSLMETGLWCLLITLLGFALIEQRRNRVALLLALLVITRPESMLWGAWAVVLLFVQADKGHRLKQTWFPAGAFICACAALVGFRLLYFGYPVPNTYYAKISPDRAANLAGGVAYLFRYVFSTVGVLAGVIAWAAALSRGWKSDQARLALFLLPGLGIPVLVGGDHFGGFRFYQPVWPLLCVLAAKEWPVLAARWRPHTLRRSVALVAALGWVLFPATVHMKHEFKNAYEGRAVGTALTHMFRDLEDWPTVAVITAGGHKLTYPGHVYDLMGLNSTEMAHAPGEGVTYRNHSGFNREVFYHWNPDVLLCGDSFAFDSLVLNGLHEEARFRAQYTKCTLYRNGAECTAYFSNAFLMNMPANEKYTIP